MFTAWHLSAGHYTAMSPMVAVCWRDLCTSKALPSVTIPNRPANIRTTNTILLAGLSCPTTPTDDPVVAIADVGSNAIWLMSVSEGSHNAVR